MVCGGVLTAHFGGQFLVFLDVAGEKVHVLKVDILLQLLPGSRQT